MTKIIETIGTTESRKRQAQVDAGVYDGRYTTKVAEDKKKKLDKTACRIFKQSKNEYDTD